MTSIRLTIFVLLILAFLSILGTFIPQGEPAGRYLSRFGPNLGSFLLNSGLTNLYYSPWFLLPITLLAANLTACLINGLPQAVRRVAKPFTVEAALSLPERGKVTWAKGADPHPRVKAVLRRELGAPQQVAIGDQEIYFYEKGRFRPLGPYIVHLALLFILMGGLVGKFWGIQGRLALNPGETQAAFETDEQYPQPLGFQVRLERFQVNYYPKEAIPMEFRSDLTFLKDGQEAAKVICRVNEPVTFGGFTFYQSSYGAQPTGPVRVLVQVSDEKQVLELKIRQPVDLPGTRAKVMAVRLDGNLQGMGPAVQLAYMAGPGHPHLIWVLKNHPEAADDQDSPFWQSGPLRFQVVEAPFEYFSVLQVKRDPGVWWVYLGFILLLPGFYLAFFRLPQRWAVVLKPDKKGGWQVRLLGASSRAREAFAVTQERLLQAIKEGGPS